MTIAKLVLGIVSKPLEAQGYMCTETGNGAVKFHNPDNDSDISFYRGRYRNFIVDYSRAPEYRFRPHLFDPRYGLGLEDGLFGQFYYSLSELESIIYQYLDITICYAIPLLNRLPVPCPHVTMEMYASLSINVESRAKRWASENNMPLRFEAKTLETLQNSIDQIRNGDYAKEHFEDALERILDLAASLGEIVIGYKKHCQWGWIVSDNLPEGYYISCNCEYFDPVMAIKNWWIYGPELSEYSFLVQCEKFFLRANI